MHARNVSNAIAIHRNLLEPMCELRGSEWIRTVSGLLNSEGYFRPCGALLGPKRRRRGRGTLVCVAKLADGRGGVAVCWRVATCSGGVSSGPSGFQRVLVVLVGSSGLWLRQRIRISLDGNQGWQGWAHAQLGSSEAKSQGLAGSTFLLWDNGVPLRSVLPSDPANHCYLGAPDIPLCASALLHESSLCPTSDSVGSPGSKTY